MKIKEQVLDLLKAGTPKAHIAKEVNCSEAYVSQLSKRSGIDVPKLKTERGYKHERLISHYFFTGAHQNDTFIENAY